MFPASAIGKKPTISAKTHDLKNKIFLGALTKTGADGDDHLAFFFTWPKLLGLGIVFIWNFQGYECYQVEEQISTIMYSVVYNKPDTRARSTL